ncbi:proline-rich transmembrane protein 1-like [Dreissena polymorpha]|uniref:proline-rich transmembrane protein 1-like n=1 Tax=Dreissena polymorpha TaxID=45954 RepID=UPI0022646BB8|nr:proline-rich transmembrane protein 1-like [Dreissena polymorpha]
MLNIPCVKLLSVPTSYEPPPQTQLGYVYDEPIGLPMCQTYGFPERQNQSTDIVTQPFPTIGIVMQTRLPNNMAVAVFVCFCCFFPTGLVAVVFAFKVSSQARSGDYEKASRNATNVRNLVIASVIIGLIIYVSTSGLLTAGVLFATRKLRY